MQSVSMGTTLLNSSKVREPKMDTDYKLVSVFFHKLHYLCYLVSITISELCSAIPSYLELELSPSNFFHAL